MAIGEWIVQDHDGAISDLNCVDQRSIVELVLELNSGAPVDPEKRVDRPSIW